MKTPVNVLEQYKSTLLATHLLKASSFELELPQDDVLMLPLSLSASLFLVVFRDLSIAMSSCVKSPSRFKIHQDANNPFGISITDSTPFMGDAIPRSDPSL
jgi:hypothetical protein